MTAVTPVYLRCTLFVPKEEKTKTISNNAQHITQVMFTPHHRKYLPKLFPVPPQLQLVDSALASGLLVFDALWSADSRAQGLEPANKESNIIITVELGIKQG